MLLKVNPARNVSNLLANEGGGVYSIGWTYVIDHVERNGITLTETTGTPTVNDQWSYENDTFKVKLAAVPSDTNVLVIFYSLFYTSNKHRITTVDPENPATDEIHWLPKLLSEPTVGQSVVDIISGVLSSTISSIELENADWDFQNYLTDEDSIYRKKVQCWLCINGVTNINKVYEGRVVRLSVKDSQISLTISDSLAMLDQPASFGDQQEEIIYNTDAFPDVYPPNIGFNIPMVLGNRSVNSFKISEPGALKDADIPHEGMHEAVCVDFVEGGGIFDNRVWSLCRYIGAPKQVTFGTITQLDYADNGTTTCLVGLKTSGFNARAFDGCTVSEAGKTASQGFILKDDTHQYDYGGGVDTYDLQILAFYAAADPDPNYTIAATILSDANGAPPIKLWHEPTNSSMMMSSGYYNSSVVTTSAGNKRQVITLTGGVENIGQLPPFLAITGETSIDPSTGFRMFFIGESDADTVNHAQVLEKMALGAGLDTNAASFTSAKSALAIDTEFSIPQVGESTPSSYRKYMTDILRGTMGIIFLNNDFEIEYQLLTAPTSSDVTNSDLYLKDSISVDVEYQDIVTELVASNPNMLDEASSVAALSPKATVIDRVPEYLHGIYNTVQYPHVLEQITSRIATIFSILKHRLAVYKFKVATDNLTSDIGDDIKFDSPIVLGGSGTQQLKIVAINKSVDGVVVEASDLLGI